MCGILGVRWSWLVAHRPDADAAFRRAADALRWRGPDGLGLAGAGDWRLACARLAISDPRSRQPVQARRSGLVGVLNGALTGARAAWEARWPGRALRQRLPNDAWLPLEWIAGGRLAVATAAHGHFAAAVVDPRDDALWLLRDPFGEKPLLVLRQAGAVVAFASTPAALRALGIELAWPEPALAAFFRFGFGPGPVPVTTGLELDTELAGAIGGSEALPAPAPVRQPVAPADLRRRVIAATARCADAEVGAALALSGGLDSACLALALRTAGRPLPAFQFQAHGTPPGERQRARLAAAAAGLELHCVDGGPELLDRLPELTAGWGAPLGDPSVLAVHALARAVAGAGHRVLLSGEGADEAWFGYRRHAAVHWLRHVPRLGGPFAAVRPWRTGYGARLLRALGSAERYEELLSVTPPGFRASVLVPELAHGSLGLPPGPPGLPRAAAADLRYLRWDLLPKLDVAAMQAGVEGRSPFLDREVMTAWAPPQGHWLGKRALRAAFQDELPRAVIRGPKQGFGLPLDRWFRGELPLLDLLLSARSLTRPHLRRDGVRAAIDRHRRGEADLGHGLYLLAAWETHLRAVEAAGR